MKKYISLLSLILASAVIACTPQNNNTDNETEVYAGTLAKVTAPSDPIPAAGGTFDVKVLVDLEFDVSIPANATWLSASPVESTGKETVIRRDEAGNDYEVEMDAWKITFTAPENKGAFRYASVALVDKEGLVFYRLDVPQESAEAETPVVVYKDFSVSKDALSVEASATSASFNITADAVEWTVTSDNASFVPTPASGSANATVEVAFPANTKESEVTATLTVSTTSNEVRVKSYTVVITQAAYVPSLPPVKPAAGTVLAEWEFETNNKEALRSGGIEGVSLEDDNKPGNVGDPYVPSNISGKGKLEYFNGTDKSAYSTKKHKRRIGDRGELCIYGSWKDDAIVWTASTETGAPLAAGTKIKLNFALRPNGAGCMRDWKCEVLDGDSWTVLEAVQLKYNSGGDGSEANPKQFNAIIERTATLTKDTPYAKFRFTCTTQINSEGSEISELVKGDALRFAGKFLEADDTNKYLQVPENPKIVVVE